MYHYNCNCIFIKVSLQIVEPRRELEAYMNRSVTISPSLTSCAQHNGQAQESVWLQSGQRVPRQRHAGRILDIGCQAGRAGPQPTELPTRLPRPSPPGCVQTLPLGALHGQAGPESVGTGG